MGKTHHHERHDNLKVTVAYEGSKSAVDEAINGPVRRIECLNAIIGDHELTIEGLDRELADTRAKYQGEILAANNSIAKLKLALDAFGTAEISVDDIVAFVAERMLNYRSSTVS